MDVRILGPFEVRADGRVLELGGRRPRTLLAALVLRAWEPVATDRLVDELWGEAPPPSANHLLHVYVSSLRKQIGTRLVTRAPGYALELAEDELDARRFERLVAEGRRLLAGADPEAASTTLRDASALWRGPALADFTYEPFAQGEIARLEELRLVAEELRFEAELALGRQSELVGELEAFVREHPLRERPRGQLMLALYRSGRQAEALEVYRTGRRLLVDELGIEPGRALRDLEQAMLRQDAALDLEEAVARLATPGPTRRLVTVVASSLGREASVDALDPEARQRVVGPALERVSQALGRHGAVVERSAGEEIVAAFGVRAAHEDDALRAVRAAFDARDALGGDEKGDGDRARGELSVRFGIETGEAVVEEGVVTGGSVVLAAVDLCRSADPGDILVGATAFDLTAHGVVADPRPAGNGDVRRLLAVRPDAPALPTRLDAPLVGRVQELDRLRQGVERAFRERVATFLTVIADAGVGKSRLARELVGLAERQAMVLVGRCASHGEELTFGPLRRMIGQAAGDAAPETVLARLDDDDRAAVAAAIGTEPSARNAATRRGETFRAITRLVSLLAQDRSLLLVFEDVHWGEPMLLDLVEHLAKRLGAVPVAVLCLARPDLLEERPAWMDHGRDDARVMLEPLSTVESAQLLESLVGAATLAKDVRAGVIALAEGNPLFLEQTAAMLAQQPDVGSQLDLPPTIRSLVAARLDRLGPGERVVIDRASIIGRDFQLPGLLELLPEEVRGSADRHVSALVRRHLLEPSAHAVGDALRFRHALIHEAVYRAIPKAVRAELHERFADWLAVEEARRLGEVEEVLGYHLEQAYGLLAEVSPDDPEARALALRAREHLEAAGARALHRGDVAAATGLLERALRLADAEAPSRAELLYRLAEVHALGGGVERAMTLRLEALERARAAEDRGLELRLAVADADTRFAISGGPGPAQELKAVVMPELAERGDALGLSRAWAVIGRTEMAAGRHVEALDAFERALHHAEGAGDLLTRDEAAVWLVNEMGDGPTPVADVLRRAESLRDSLGPTGAAAIGPVTAFMLAMQGRLEEARALFGRTRAQFEEMGIRSVVLHALAGEAELVAGEAELAERELSVAWELVSSGDQVVPWITERLARALRELGRLDEAERFLVLAQRHVSEDEGELVPRVLATKALVLLDRGDAEEACRVALNAAALSEALDSPPFESPRYRAEILLAVAEVLGVAGRRADAATHALTASRTFERKGNVVSAARARALGERLARDESSDALATT